MDTSLPSWERGLKYKFVNLKSYKPLVAPFVGAWIEIAGEDGSIQVYVVAPFVGAWIEINKTAELEKLSKSLPSWERGLKYRLYIRGLSVLYCRSLRGSVD